MIYLTERAATKVKELLKEEDPAFDWALRVGVMPGGCSGFQYEMYFDSDIADQEWTEVFDGVKVVVDPFSAPKLLGATIDWREGLMGAGFKIDNPRETRSCGCGKSFS